ncbi:hypothetical protein RRG08_028741 [Elysia crispata]|uniref:Uncharacterized protein n=1 Tax=Elysia crispata TaxID=231223 RepID=A0AAE0ZLU5_9GAST|nr:hypothetical protein RRG08_028741 [Elysia crispata]
MHSPVLLRPLRKQNKLFHRVSSMALSQREEPVRGRFTHDASWFTYVSPLVLYLSPRRVITVIHHCCGVPAATCSELMTLMMAAAAAAVAAAAALVAMVFQLWHGYHIYFPSRISRNNACYHRHALLVPHT